MLQALKTSVTVVLGLLLGCLVAIPLAWYGARRGADTLMANVWQGVSVVQERQQAMADEALKLQPMLQHFGAEAGADVFKDVEDERSLLAGDATLKAKLEHLQGLEEALLRSERVWALAGKHHARLAAWPPYADYGRVWEQQKRLLVREEKDLSDSVDEFDGLLGRWPFSGLLAHKTFAGMSGNMLSDAAGNALFMGRVGLDWLGYGLRRLAALVGQQAPPPPPVWGWRPPQDDAEGAYATALPPLVFLGGGPLPEGDYREIQYTQEVPANYANVQLGEDKAVLENQGAPSPYAAPVPQPQRTVVYSAPN